MMEKEILKIAYLAGNNDSLEAETNKEILEYFEVWYENTGKSLVKKSNDIQNVSDLFNEFCDFVTEDLDMGVDDYDRNELFEKFNNR